MESAFGLVGEGYVYVLFLIFVKKLNKNYSSFKYNLVGQYLLLMRLLQDQFLSLSMMKIR
jgi:hypothetical protein